MARPKLDTLSELAIIREALEPLVAQVEVLRHQRQLLVARAWEEDEYGGSAIMNASGLSRAMVYRIYEAHFGEPKGRAPRSSARTGGEDTADLSHACWGVRP